VAEVPTISVVMSVQEPWPMARRALDALHTQTADVGGEIVVPVARRDALPPDFSERYPSARFIEVLGGSVFRLRAEAITVCRAPIVALTEDHAYVEADWCRRMLAAHAAHPEAAAIGGVVENGATGTLADRIGFLIANGPFLPPVADGPGATVSQQANVSYKRSALPTAPSPLGFMVHTFHEELHARGGVLRTDSRIVVFHVQELPLAGHMAGHFHNGRSIAAFRAIRMPAWWRAVRFAGCAVLPPVMLGRTLRTVWPKRRFRLSIVVGLPLMAWLLCCHAAGEALGYVAGPGRSPERVN
jgi:hypothetical protein